MCQNTAAGRARRRVRRYVAHHNLSCVPVLRVEPDNPNLIKEFDRYIERLQYHLGDFVWLAVPEYDKQQRAHIHLFLQNHLDISHLQDQWVKPFDSPDSSFFGIKVINSIEGVRKYGNYVGKLFALPASQRPTRRRYRLSQHPRPQPLVFHGVTKEDLDIMRARIEDISQSNVSTWENDSFICPQVDQWEPNPTTTDAVVEMLKSFKPV